MTTPLHPDAAAWTATVDSAEHGTLQIAGRCHPAYEAVARAFAANFAGRDEVGASVALVQDGRLVVDLWGGLAVRAGDDGPARPWAEDTVSVIFSATKGATAIALHLAAARGLLDLDQKVVEIWPEFAGRAPDPGPKRDATVRMILDHSIGLPVLTAPLKADCVTDYPYMIARIEEEAPLWQPGTRTGYHPITMGFMAAEVLRRVDGRSLGRFFAEEIAGPLGLDFWIGLPESVEPRVAPVIVRRAQRGADLTPFLAAAKQPGTIQHLFVFNNGTYSSRGANTREGHAAEIGAAGGITNARALASLYAATLPGAALGFDADTVAGFAEASSATQIDATLLQPTRFGPGFMLRMDNRRRPQPADSVIIGHRAYGHVGAGGSIGFADPERGMAFGYTMTKLGAGLLLNARGQALVDAGAAATDGRAG
ncbi:serine hydrolase (plasmid) [Tistrella mobilis]|uniref:serine hydrolase domain-containing protein n=1 Tax=Tistrella mobilis TaxID=171437 RepID=UPI0035588EF9